ncbi:DUF3791 domain-containing protein [Treponema sp.]|uniref:DUF3791 domain-containing protein n=1 Tax=Treponema sp. TaxID=166 RepID=UPI00298E33E3|nr:DUF3791 domain-containing protein [Treponema sp.]
MNYLVACVSEFAHAFSMNTKDAFGYLYDYKAIVFLKENYDIEHTLSFYDAIEDMTAICRKNGGSL